MVCHSSGAGAEQGGLGWDSLGLHPQLLQLPPTNYGKSRRQLSRQAHSLALARQGQGAGTLVSGFNRRSGSEYL